MPRPRKEIVDSGLLVTPQPQLSQLLDQKLKCASDLGHQLATVIATFEKELNDWQASIARLQGAPNSTDVSKNCDVDGHGKAGGAVHHLSDPVPCESSPQQLQQRQAPELAVQRVSVSTIASSETIAIKNNQPQLWDVWTNPGTFSKRKLQSAANQFGSRIEIPSPEEGGLTHVSYLDRFVISPLSTLRYTLDTVSLAVILYDIITFPLMAFDFDDSQAGKYGRFVSASYWTLDLFCSFFTGYQLENGEIEMQFWKVIKKRFWTALFDLSIVLLDWSLYILDQAKGSAVLARVARLIRLARFVRAVRTRILFIAIENVKTLPISANSFTVFNVMRLILKVIVINHFLGCGWYAVGRMDSDDGQSWVREWLNPHDHKVVHYLVSYHWSIAQFTPCPMNIHPTNSYERLYSVLLLPFGLVVFAVLLGSVTAIVNSRRKSSYEALMAKHNLQQFLRTNRVPPVLSTRIKSYIKAHRMKKTRILESDVPTLTTLASSLRQELHFEIHGPVLKRHPMFQLLNNFHDTFVHFCHTATTMITLPFGEEIFRYRSKGENMLVPLSGTLEYDLGRQFDDSCKDVSCSKVFIKSGGWVCEHPLWISWENRGLLAVGEQSDLVVINPEKLRKAASGHSSSLPLLKKYAQLFAKTMALDAEVQEIDDLWGTKYGRTFRIFEDVEHLDSILNKPGMENGFSPVKQTGRTYI